MKTIHIYPVSVEEINDWLMDAIYATEGHDQNVIGTIGLMLEDFSEFIYEDPKRRKQFMAYLELAEKEDEVLH